jgi:hypothetical protein
VARDAREALRGWLGEQLPHGIEQQWNVRGFRISAATPVSIATRWASGRAVMTIIGSKGLMVVSRFKVSQPPLTGMFKSSSTMLMGCWRNFSTAS